MRVEHSNSADKWSCKLTNVQMNGYHLGIHQLRPPFICTFVSVDPDSFGGLSASSPIHFGLWLVSTPIYLVIY